MLKSDVEWPNSRRFKSGTEWEPIGFFSEGLCNSTQFDLLLGFFSSSAISVLCDGFAVFLHNGGKMRLIINEILTEQDKHAIQNGSCGKEFPEFDLSNIEDLKKTLSTQDQHFFDCLSWLISKDKLEIKIVSPANSQGISHTKSGILSDGINRIGFDGSCNFSRTALISNIESLTCSCDWDGPVANANIEDISSDFEKTFFGENPNVKMLDVEDIKASISTAFPTKDIKELLQESKRLTNQKYASDDLPSTVRRALAKARRKVSEVIDAIHLKEKKTQEFTLPHFPYPSGPREYQQIAFERWKDNTQKGLFAMATGTGKTITSLNCLLEIYKKGGYYKALILVPTITLVNQWAAECRKFGFNNIIKVSSKNPNWRSEIDNIEFNES